MKYSFFKFYLLMFELLTDLMKILYQLDILLTLLVMYIKFKNYLSCSKICIFFQDIVSKELCMFISSKHSLLNENLLD